MWKTNSFTISEITRKSVPKSILKIMTISQMMTCYNFHKHKLLYFSDECVNKYRLLEMETLTNINRLKNKC